MRAFDWRLYFNYRISESLSSPPWHIYTVLASPLDNVQHLHCRMNTTRRLQYHHRLLAAVTETDQEGTWSDTKPSFIAARRVHLQAPNTRFALLLSRSNSKCTGLSTVSAHVSRLEDDALVCRTWRISRAYHTPAHPAFT